MKARTFGRHIKEGGKNIVRNGWMTFASISAVTVMLLVVGAFLIMLMNVNEFAQALEDDVEIRVFIELASDEEDQEILYDEIDQISGVESIQFVPKEEGLETFIDSLGDQGDYFEGLRDENPLNDAYVVRATDPDQTEIIAQQIQELDSVEGTEYGQDIFEQLFSATNFVRIVGLALIAGLVFTAIFLIANTIKLTIVARKREIQIMKLVGATNSFIRWPFFIEGLLLGTLGALIPITVLGYSYNQLYQALGNGESGLDFFQFLPTFPLVIQTGVLLLAIGGLVGVWGSIMSVRKFLRV